MSRYVVYLAAVAEFAVEVEADTADDAIEAAFETHLPRTNISNDFELGDWTLPSELFRTAPEEDYEELR